MLARSWRWWLVGSILVSLCALAPWTVSGSNQAARVAPGPVEISVLSADAGKPLAGVVVRLGGRYTASGADGKAILDGVPAGDYPLVVAHTGYDRLERKVTLPAGRRQPLTLRLPLTQMVPLSGEVRFQGADHGLPGVLIELTPQAVPAAAQGVYLFNADWEGRFEIREIPVGRYRAVLSTPGAHPRTLTLDVRPGMRPVLWEVQRVFQPADLRVRVVDALTGRPVPGARVEVGECLPAGFIAAGTADGSGQAWFKGLRLARLNWVDQRQRLTGSRRPVMVRASARGYQAGAAPAMLGPGASVEVQIDPVRTLAEQEPNNSFDQAQPIHPGATVNLKIATRGDRDFFRFTLRHPGVLKVELGSAGVLDAWTTLIDNKGRRIHSHGTNQTKNNTWERELTPGAYTLQVEEWGNNGASDKVIPLTLSFTPVLDPNEPNDNAPRLAATNVEVRGCIFPRGDVDRYRFEVQRPGWLRVASPAHPMERHLMVFDRLGRKVGEVGIHRGKAGHARMAVKPGWHRLEVWEWGNNGSSTEPYQVSIQMMADDGVDDPDPGARPMTAKRTLEPGDLAAGTIFPRGDVDTYAITVPSSGRIMVRTTAPIEIHVMVFDAGGRQLSEHGQHAGKEASHSLNLSGPQTVYLQVWEWGNNGDSPWPYILTTRWEPCDEMEALARNDKRDSAFPAPFGETLRGNIQPLHDVDVYQLDVDHPGELVLDLAPTPLELHLMLYDADGRKVAEQGVHRGKPMSKRWQVLEGRYYLEIWEWGNNGQSVEPYHLKVDLDRAQPGERTPLANDPVRRLSPGVAEAFKIEMNDDRDRFRFEMPAKGKFAILSWSPVETHFRLFDDLTGKQIVEWGVHAARPGNRVVETDGPTRYRLEVTEWGMNGRSLESGFLMFDPQERSLAGEKITAAVDPTDPTRVSFRREALQGVGGAARVLVDANGDGKVDLDLPPGGGRDFRYGREGLYLARVLMEGGAGVRSHEQVWVSARGPMERVGVRLLVQYPGEGQLIEGDQPARAAAISYSGVPVDRVSLAVDGRHLASDFTPPYEFQVPWRSLGPGAHQITFTARDKRGQSSTLIRNVKVSDYFDLMPEDGAVITGQTVKVSWNGAAFGRAQVRYRREGQPDWNTATGENGRQRMVELGDLEPGAPYEIQPLGGGEPGPVRTLTRVKGLAFGRGRYGAHIKRDYDQKVGVSVRNHAEKPMKVKLECGRPPEASRLLVGFVGQGSEDAPFTLQPGEEREFWLGISAQDCLHPVVRFPIRMASDTGYSDQAEVVLNVKIPKVELAWEEVGPLKDRLGRKYRLINKGDTLTDLAVAADSPDLLVSPFIGHGLIKAGQRMDFEVTPRLHEGFQRVSAKLTASAVGQTIAQPVDLALPAGQKVFAVQLTPGMAPPADAGPPQAAGGQASARSGAPAAAKQTTPGELSQQDLMTARSLAGAYLDPSYVDWSKRTQPTDTDGDGRPDRWFIEDRLENVHWVGDDTDGDGAIDFVHGDVGFDGQFDFSAFKGDKGWEPTNLVETWLEMGFSLPWARSAYEKHDADIIFNDQVVGKLRDSIPEGNYTFRVPPSALKFSRAGIPEGNQVSISSKHLRGGHYVVSSDFRVKMRMTGTRVHTVAGDRNQAMAKAYAMKGLTAQGPDYSVSSAELTLAGKQEKGAEILVSLPVRNVGATSSRDLAVALMRAAPGGKKPVELARRYLAVGPLTGSEQVELTWRAAAGNHSLMVVVDPDQASGDTNHDNNTAIVNLSIPGDEAPPALEILEPADNQAFNETGVRLRVKATDDSGVARVQFRVDGALPQDLPPAGGDTYGAVAVIQPGNHTLTALVMDGSGNQVEKKVRIKIDAKAPTLRIESPAADSKVAERTVRVQLLTGADAQTAAVRINGGPWIGAQPRGGRAEVTLPLDFGPCLIEAMAAGASGARGTAQVKVECTAQPSEEQKRREEAHLTAPSGGGVALSNQARVDVLSPGAAPLVNPRARAADQPADHELSLYDNFNDQPPEPTRFAVISVTRERPASRLGAVTLWDPGQATLPYKLMRGDEVVHQGLLRKGSCPNGQEQWCQGWDDALEARLRPGIYKLRMDEPRLGRNQASRRNGMVKLFAEAQPGDKPYVAPSPRREPDAAPGGPLPSGGTPGAASPHACQGTNSAAFTITTSQVVSGLATRLRWSPGQTTLPFQVLKGSSILAAGSFRKKTPAAQADQWDQGSDTGLNLRLAPGVYKIKTAGPLICKTTAGGGFAKVAVTSDKTPPGATAATLPPVPVAQPPAQAPDPSAANAGGGTQPPGGAAAAPQAGAGAPPQAAGTPPQTAGGAGAGARPVAPWQPGGANQQPGAAPGPAPQAGAQPPAGAQPQAGPGAAAPQQLQPPSGQAAAPQAPQAGQPAMPQTQPQAAPQGGGQATPQAPSQAPQAGPGGGLCGQPFNGERDMAGHSPATDQQPPTLPPVRPDVPLPDPGAGDARPPWRPAGWNPPRPPAGGFIGSRVQNRDWYCTNRPSIKVPFRLPDWLRKINLTYANREEYERMVNKFLAAMRARGIDTSRLEKFQDMLRRRVMQLEQAGDLPGWLESMGFAGPKPTDPAKLKEWREQMLARADAWYLRLLASGDPKLIAQGLKARAQAIGKFDQAMADHANAAITQIEANQTLINDIAEALPVVGEMADIYAVVTGETALSGRQISSLEAVLRLAGVLGPPGLTELAKRSPTTRLILEGLAEMGQNMGKAGHEMLVAALAKAKVLGDPSDIRKGLAALGDFMTKERRLFGQTAEDAASRAGREFASTAEGIAAKNRYMRDYADARDVIDRLRKTDPNVNPKQYQELLMEVQKNKTAQMIMNSDRVTDAFRKQTKQQIERIYQKADDQVASSMEGLFKGRHSADELERRAAQLGIPPGQGKQFRDQVEELARRNGVSVDQVKIESMKITNKRPPKPGEVPRTSFGRDRDVTYVLVAEKNVVVDGRLVKQRIQLGDIDHAISTGPYQQAFWKHSGNGNIPRLADGTPDMSKIVRHADEADQAITSARHLEAYNTGEVQLGDFLDKSKVPPITRVEDLKDTVAYKSEHWFHLADGSKKAGNPVMYARNTAEGMRQATKQYDDLVLSRVRQYGLDLRNVPPRLNASMDVFRQVNAGKITVEQAEHMLKALGTNPAKAVKDMSYFLEALEKGPGKGFRRVKAAELVNRMARSELKAGSRAWMDQQYGMINDAFKNGHISSEQFMKLRSQVQDGAVRKLKAANPSGWRQELMSWSQAARNRCLINAAEKAAYEALN